MTDTLFSTSWYRVADLRPRLRSHAQVHRHTYRGRLWYVLQDRASARFHRFSPAAYMVIGLMDGQRTLRQIWDIACTRLGDDAPTQDEVIHIVASLHRADVLLTDAPPDLAELQQRRQKQARVKLRQYISNPLALRIPLIDPDAFVTALLPWLRPLLGWAGALLWLLLVGWALVLGASHWDELSLGVSDRLLSADNLLLIGLMFPLAKVVHEFGHAIAVKAFGGEVHEMGVMLLVLMPVPYVDASASLALRSKHARMLVGAAGMLAELLLAALAMLVWVQVEPGLVRALAFNVMMIAGITTVVFNANPLLRFDGYYILSDALEIPNLGQRSNTYFAYLVKRHLLRIRQATMADTAPGERPWFFFYAVASFIYRIFVSVAIALLVAQQYFVIGVVLGIWSLYNAFIQPLGKKIAFLFNGTELQGRRGRALATVGLLLALVTAIVGWLPAPSFTRTEGVAVVPEHGHVRAASDGFTQSVRVASGQTVRRGDVLVVLEDPELHARLRVLDAQLQEQQARYTAATGDRVQMSLIRDDIAHITARRDMAAARVRELVVRSPADGQFMMANTADAPSKFVHRGDLLAYVVDPRRLAVQVVVPQADVDLVRQMTRRVELRMVERMADVVTAEVRRVVPAATSQLPNLALSAQGGGALSLDPNAGPGTGRPGEARAAVTLFLFELDITTAPLPLAVGSRIYARFERAPEPLAAQGYRVLRGMLLTRFNV
jgi:putative peptide zinc metalloprotease protein